MTVLALSGGIGGAKLALGLSRVMPPADLVVVANTGDDFEHLGLSISPDIDTVMYTLAGLSNTEQGWGRANESWTFMAALEALGGETWFRLGDGDLATHLARTERLRAGEPLSQITADFCRRLGVGPRVVPMSEDRVRTRVRTADGWLDFQDYFVRRQCAPAVAAIEFSGAADAVPHPTLMALLRDPALRAVIICPSNPLISIGPILALPGVRAALADCPAPVIAVSPIVGDRALKGPTAKMMAELGMPVTPAGVADAYGAFLDGFVVHRGDAVAATGVAAISTNIVMNSLEDRIALANDVMAFAASLSAKTAGGRR